MGKVRADMPLTIASYTTEHTAAVAAFNERARSHEAPFELSKSPVAGWLPKGDGARVWREFFLALSGAEVRGGYTLRRQEFWLRGEMLKGMVRLRSRYTRGRGGHILTQLGSPGERGITVSAELALERDGIHYI